MTLHLLKCPVSPLAVEMLQSAGQSPSIAVLLSSTADAPPLPGIMTYWVAESAAGLSPEGQNAMISYAQLVDMIFSADKVIAW